MPIREDQTGLVGPRLGADSIRKGVLSSIIGLLLVCAFMIVYYRKSGLIANIALFMNALLILACMAYTGATLTLPGIAGRHPDHWYGRRRERADLRTHPRGSAQRQVRARVHRWRV